jgi:HEAT repeat protein
MLRDPAPVVRIAAAHALCDWGQEEKALPVLVEGLDCKTDKARLFAVTALNKIGEKARPALEQIKAHEKDPDNYVQRVTGEVLKRLGSP